MSPKAKRDSEEGPKKPSMYTLKLTKEQAEKLRGILQGKGWEPFKVDHAAFAFKAPGVNVVHYTSGKCVVSGKSSKARAGSPSRWTTRPSPSRPRA